MERRIDLEAVSDGRLYGLNDMVRAGCGDCRGCSACCRGMGTSVQLDPLDIFRLTTGLNTDFARLMAGTLELNLVDGLIIPNLKMTGEEEKCPFLNREERCSVHSLRPGFCRLFPLGRLYEKRSVSYFLQIHECRNPGRTKVKVSKWLDVEQAGAYETFVADWHYFLKDLEAAMRETGILGKPESREVCLFVLNRFYGTPYEAGAEFYPQFYTRLDQGKAFAAARGLRVL